jgi:hypothetical protein
MLKEEDKEQNKFYLRLSNHFRLTQTELTNTRFDRLPDCTDNNRTQYHIVNVKAKGSFGVDPSRASLH